MATRSKSSKKAKTKSSRKKAKAPVKKKESKKTVKAASKSTAKKSTRKTTQKSARKKASGSTVGSGRQRASSRERVYNLTKEVPHHHYFILANGRPVKHVAELASLLDQLEDHVFNHHVTPDRNDFHNWVKDVFEDIELARKVAGVDDKRHLQLVIYKHLAGHDHE